MTASAVLRVGNRAPVPLHLTPVASPDCRPGNIPIIVARTDRGEEIVITIASFEWAYDLLEAVADGIVRADMRPAVTA